ncbi:MAG: branched-chain amino acid ABC transporter permease [Chloroflexota bacterium]|nr:branched-chain amino acid ABC transporter permease [Chloroflexota bacterium]
MDFNLDLFLQILIIGITYGAMIALIALGYTLVYGIVELINFAHGEVFMMGAFFTMQVVLWVGVTSESATVAVVGALALALLAAMAFSGGINYFIDRVAYRRLRNAPRLAPLIAAIGFSFILQNIAIYWRGSNPVTPEAVIPLEIRSLNILTAWFGLDTNLRVRLIDFLVVLVTIPILIGLSWFVYRTRTGAAMRATAQDREAAALMGIDVNRTIGTAFLIGGALAGAAGMIAVYYLNSARFQMGFQYGLFAFTAAVLGGIGNLSGAVLGGFLIGIIWAMSDGFIRQFIPEWGAQWTPTVIFGLLILVLVFRPSGLLGEQVPDRA